MHVRIPKSLKRIIQIPGRCQENNWPCSNWNPINKRTEITSTKFCMKFNDLANVYFILFFFGGGGVVVGTKQSSWLHAHLFHQSLLLRCASAHAIQRTRLASNKHCLRLPSFLSLVMSSYQTTCCESRFLRLMVYNPCGDVLHLHIRAKEK